MPSLESTGKIYPLATSTSLGTLRTGPSSSMRVDVFLASLNIFTKMVTSEKFNCMEIFIFTRFLCLTTLWFLDDMVLVVSLCRVSHYQTTSYACAHALKF